MLTMEKVLEKFQKAYPPKSNFEKEMYLKEWTYKETMDPNRFWNELTRRINDVAPDMNDREKSSLAREAMSTDSDLTNMIPYRDHETLEDVNKSFVSYIGLRNNQRLRNGQKSLYKPSRTRQEANEEATNALEEDIEEEEELGANVLTKKEQDRSSILQAVGIPPGVLTRNTGMTIGTTRPSAGI